MRCFVLAVLAQVEEMPLLSFRRAISIKTTCPAWTVFSAPVLISRAFSGQRAQACPYSETCRYWSVPERIDTPTRIDELFENSNSSAASFPDLDAGLDRFRQIVIGKPDLVTKDHLRIVEAVRDGARSDVGIEQARIQHEDLNERGEAKLPRLENEVLIMQLVEQRELCPVRAKRNLAAVLINDVIQV